VSRHRQKMIAEFTAVYDHRGPVPNIFDARGPDVHTPLRRIWNRAVSGTAMKEYEKVLVRQNRQLIESLHKRHSETVDISQWMEFFS
jgi:cytochrome P450